MVLTANPAYKRFANLFCTLLNKPGRLRHLRSKVFKISIKSVAEFQSS